jgi:hypothetical protein
MIDAGKVMHGFYETKLPGWDKIAARLIELMGI